MAIFHEDYGDLGDAAVFVANVPVQEHDDHAIEFQAVECFLEWHPEQCVRTRFL